MYLENRKFARKRKVMDIQTDIQWIRQELKAVKDPDLIEAFKGMLRFRNKNQSTILENDTKIVAYTVDGKPLTLAEYQEELAESEREIERGECLTSDELEKEMATWNE